MKVSDIIFFFLWASGDIATQGCKSQLLIIKMIYLQKSQILS